MATPTPRGRFINKDISDSIGFSELSPSAQVLFCLLIPHYDPRGKINGNPGYIKGEVAPRIKHITIENIPSLLGEISEHTNVKWFENNGRRWIHSIKFLSDHQRIRTERLGPDLIPNYPGQEIDDKSRTSPGLVPDQSRPKVKVKEKEKETNPPTVPPEAAEDYISRIKKYHNELPEGFLRRWEEFYGDKLNVNSCLFAATTWLIDNPDRRKKNIEKFYSNWLRNQYTRATQPRGG